MTRTLRDLGLILAAVAASCVLGVFTNLLRGTPLPLVYENPETRMLRSISSGAESVSREPEVLEFQAALQAWKESAAVFVDARGSDYFTEGHIPRSINVSRDSIVQAVKMEVLADKSRPVIVYCSGEDCSDSRLVAQALLSLGHRNVSVYAGGWEEWEASGSPVEK